MGACALLGGIQRATIALVVIMLEGAQCNAMQCNAMQCNAMQCTALPRVFECNPAHSLQAGENSAACAKWES
jgi:hypothetical protein